MTFSDLLGYSHIILILLLDYIHINIILLEVKVVNDGFNENGLQKSRNISLSIKRWPYVTFSDLLGHYPIN